MTRHVGGASAGRPQRKLFVQQLHNSLAETLGRRLLKESFMFTEFEPKICFIPLCQRMISPASYSVGVNGDVHDIIKDVTGSIWAIPIRAKVLAYSAKADSSTLAAGECLQSQR
jgi:hypothetical protein